MAIWFHNDDYPTLKIRNRRIIKKKISDFISTKDKYAGNINFIYLRDKELLEINQTYLNHDFYTDVISFNYSELNIISGDIYISVDRLIDNSGIQNTDLNREALRVSIHGVLHFIGFNDSNEMEKAQMRKQEDLFLKSVEDLLIFSV